MRTTRIAVAMAAGIAVSIFGQSSSGPQDGSWPFYGHDAGGARFSPLTQIRRETVDRLTVAWTYHTGDLSDGTRGRQRGGFEATPLVVDGTMFLTTGFNRVIALDPETGRERWTYDP